MRNQQLKNKVIWGVGAIAALSLCYALSRHDVLGKWHSMVELPRNLYIFGTIVIVAAAFFYSRLVMSSTVIGYMAGFVLAMLFNSDYAGPGDSPGVMSYNNAWIIWTFTYIAIIVTAIMWEVIDMFLSKQNTEAAPDTNNAVARRNTNRVKSPHWRAALSIAIGLFYAFLVSLWLNTSQILLIIIGILFAVSFVVGLLIAGVVRKRASQCKSADAT